MVVVGKMPRIKRCAKTAKRRIMTVSTQKLPHEHSKLRPVEVEKVKVEILEKSPSRLFTDQRLVQRNSGR